MRKVETFRPDGAWSRMMEVPLRQWNSRGEEEKGIERKRERERVRREMRRDNNNRKGCGGCGGCGGWMESEYLVAVVTGCWLSGCLPLAMSPTSYIQVHTHTYTHTHIHTSTLPHFHTYTHPHIHTFTHIPHTYHTSTHPSTPSTHTHHTTLPPSLPPSRWHISA